MLNRAVEWAKSGFYDPNAPADVNAQHNLSNLQGAQVAGAIADWDYDDYRNEMEKFQEWTTTQA